MGFPLPGAWQLWVASTGRQDRLWARGNESR